MIKIRKTSSARDCAMLFPYSLAAPSSSSVAFAEFLLPELDVEAFLAFRRAKSASFRAARFRGGGADLLTLLGFLGPEDAPFSEPVVADESECSAGGASKEFAERPVL